MKPRKPSYNLKLRLSLVGMVLTLAVTALLVRAVDLQVLRKEFYQQQGDARHLREVAIPAYRGSIFDRNGEPLAISVPVASIWANPRELLAEPERVPELAAALRMESSLLEQRLARFAEREFVFLRRHLAPDDAEAILALGIPGVHSQREFRRYYPSGEVAGQVVGFTNIDDAGQEGLELAFNDWLSGRPGAKRVIRDRRGRIIEGVELVREAVPGRDLVLSIDRRLQYLAHRELRQALREFDATSGSVVVMDVGSGEILAMVNLPTFNPNHRGSAVAGSQRNRAVTDVFEPGSIIKAFTVAAALESGRFHPGTQIDTSPGRLTVGNHVVTDINNYGLVDLTRLLTKSSNVGAVRLAQGLSSEHFWHTFHRFGFGQVTGSGFPGESPGFMPPAQRLRELEKATLSYGYGLSVTPLQMGQAYVALANGGRLRAPTFLLGVRNPEEGVIDPSIARTVLEMMESVIGPEGTGHRAAVHNYRVSGKTGTSRIVGAQGYESRYIASFAGVAPMDNPRLVAVVVLQDPRGNAYYGGTLAAPVFARVMSGALRLLAVPPDAPATLLAGTPPATRAPPLLLQGGGTP